MTLLLTTQYLEEADALADRVVLIDRGREVAAGTPAQLKAQVGEQRVDVIAADGGRVRARSACCSAARFDVSESAEQRTVSVAAPDEAEDLAERGRRGRAGRHRGRRDRARGVRRSTTRSSRSPVTRRTRTTTLADRNQNRRRWPHECHRSSRPVTAPFPASGARAAGVAFVRDTALLTGRSLRAIPRVPERLLDVTIQPIVFILLFLYVFGSAIHVPGVSYKDYLFPGIIGQSLAFGIIGAGVATSHDMTEGVIDRFRSLPISRLSIISAQVMGQFCEQVLGHDDRRRCSG